MESKLINWDTFFIIAGPCVIEEESIMFKTAEKLKLLSEKYKIPVIYKSSFQKDNRSSTDNFAGPGLEQGLLMLENIKKQFNFPVISDVHYPEQVKAAAEVLDVIQIPAYLCMQTTLVVEAAKTGKIINLKHGQFISPQNMVHPVKKVESCGNKDILITERGYAFGYNDLVVDPRSFYDLGKLGYPVIFDITHSIRKYGIPSSDPSGGARQYLSTLARAGVAAGVDGVFIETHPEPSKALCDASSQLKLESFEEFLLPIIELHNIEKKFRKHGTLS